MRDAFQVNRRLKRFVELIAGDAHVLDPGHIALGKGAGVGGNDTAVRRRGIHIDEVVILNGNAARAPAFTYGML